MIQELVQLAERVRRDRKDQFLVHDSLCEERLDVFIYITPDGRFLDFIPTEKRDAVVEDLVRTENKGKTSNVLARLILGNEKYVLGLPDSNRNSKCLNDYLKKLHQYDNVTIIKEVLNFYEKNKELGLNVAQKEFKARIESKKLKTGTNFSFLIRRRGDEDTVAHSTPELIKEIKKRYDENEKKLKGDSQDLCSVCGKNDHRVRDLSTHGTITGILPRNPLGNYLVSYEGKAFTSYGLDGNDNSFICTHCAKAYVEAMNWLLKPSRWVPTGKRNKLRPEYKNRKDIPDSNSDTTVLFWLKHKREVPDIELLFEPDEAAIQNMFESVPLGKPSPAQKLESEKFYSVTVSGVAARIAIRDWMESSLENLRLSLVKWFEDIKVLRYDPKDSILKQYYPPFNILMWKVRRNLKGKSDNDDLHRRIGATLWKCAVVRDYQPPLWLISSVLNRIRAEQGNISPERISLLQLYLKRKNNSQERSQAMPDKNVLAQNVAYTCGQIFAVLESIQHYAMGKNINAPIRQRFFSSASTMPSTAFGRLCKLAQHHLSKIQTEKPGLAVNLDKKLQELFSQIEGHQLPAVFSIEDQASFSIGYYHQKQKEFSN
jgi:CRISPR-associated protein Csd1